jgi:hypothetical protein
MEIFSHPDIPEILSLPGNSNCCDCNAEKPKWASLNNGIFLCLKCAGAHRSLGVDISTIRSLQIDSWTDKQILYLSKGGNDKFKKNLSDYQIDVNSQTDLKYKSKASDYYRKVLKNEVEKSSNKDYKEVEIIKPSLEEGKEILDIKKGQSEVNNSNVIGKYDEPKKEEGFLNTLGSFLNTVKQTAGDVAGKITKEIDELKIGDKLKEAGDTVVDYAKASGNFIKDKSNQALNSEFVQGITKTAESGINTVIEKTKVLLNNNNNQNQDVNPELLKKNEAEAENQKNENLQMSEIINNDINNINNINKDNLVLNNGENQIENNDNKEKLNNPIEQEPKEEKKEENKSNYIEGENNANADANKNEEEKVKQEQENPQNP